jgi:hypothetical protein
MVADDQDDSDGDDEDDDSDSSATLSNCLDALKLPALVSLAVQAKYSGDESDPFYWDQYPFENFVTRSKIQTQLQNLSLKGIVITQEQLLATLAVLVNLRQLKLFPSIKGDSKAGTPYPLSPKLFSRLTAESHSPLPSAGSTSVSSPHLLPNLTHLSVRVRRGDNGNSFSKIAVMKEIAKMAESRLAGHAGVSRLIELEVFGFDATTPDPSSVLHNLISLRQKGLYCHGRDW